MFGSDVEDLVFGIVQQVDDSLKGDAPIFILPTRDMLYHTVTCGSVGGVGRLYDELVASVLQHLYPLLLLLDHQRRQGINSALDDFGVITKKGGEFPALIVIGLIL